MFLIGMGNESKVPAFTLLADHTIGYTVVPLGGYSYYTSTTGVKSTGFVINSYEGSIIYSIDGANWNLAGKWQQNSGENWFKVIYSHGIWTTFSNRGRSLWSEDGVNLNLGGHTLSYGDPANGSYNWISYDYYDDTLFAVSSNGDIAYSTCKQGDMFTPYTTYGKEYAVTGGSGRNGSQDPIIGNGFVLFRNANTTNATTDAPHESLYQVSPGQISGLYAVVEKNTGEIFFFKDATTYYRGNVISNGNITTVDNTSAIDATMTGTTPEPVALKVGENYVLYNQYGKIWTLTPSSDAWVEKTSQYDDGSGTRITAPIIFSNKIIFAYQKNGTAKFIVSSDNGETFSALDIGGNSNGISWEYLFIYGNNLWLWTPQGTRVRTNNFVDFTFESKPLSDTFFQHPVVTGRTLTALALGGENIYSYDGGDTFTVKTNAFGYNDWNTKISYDYNGTIGAATGQINTLKEIQISIGGQGNGGTAETLSPVKVYTVPAGKKAIISSITVANTNASQITYDLGILSSGQSLTHSNSTKWDSAIPAHHMDYIPGPITMTAGQSVVVLPSTVNAVDVKVYGSEQNA